MLLLLLRTLLLHLTLLLLHLASLLLLLGTAWLGTLDDDDIQAVAAYVFDQATGDKW